MQRTAIFPGSFDPVTLGHVEIVRRAMPLFDRIILVMAVNTLKKYHFTQQQRMEMLHLAFEDMPNVDVHSVSGLTVKFAQAQGAQFILRGVRDIQDFSYERTVSQVNRSVAPQLETVCLYSHQETEHISSTVVREFVMHGHELNGYVPASVIDYISALDHHSQQM